MLISTREYREAPPNLGVHAMDVILRYPLSNKLHFTRPRNMAGPFTPPAHCPGAQVEIVLVRPIRSLAVSEHMSRTGRGGFFYFSHAARDARGAVTVWHAVEMDHRRVCPVPAAHHTGEGHTLSARRTTYCRSAGPHAPLWAGNRLPAEPSVSDDATAHLQFNTGGAILIHRPVLLGETLPPPLAVIAIAAPSFSLLKRSA